MRKRPQWLAKHDDILGEGIAVDEAFGGQFGFRSIVELYNWMYENFDMSAEQENFLKMRLQKAESGLKLDVGSRQVRARAKLNKRREGGSVGGAKGPHNDRDWETN